MSIRAPSAMLDLTGSASAFLPFRGLWVSRFQNAPVCQISILLRAFTPYVRPLVEYCSSVWSPHTVTNINKLESVQRRFTKKITGLSKFPYSVWLKKLNLETLESRRLKCDLVTLYKLIAGSFSSDCHDFVQFSMYSSTRGHDLKIQKQCAAVDAFKHNFPNRIIGVWNELPDCVVKASTCFIFRRLVDGLDLQKYCLVCD